MKPKHRGNKADLPSKRCVACGKLFTWRKKWARDWEQVKYCSERCRRSKPNSPPGT
jgi:hypothetical protein